jgi:hypothetical protein
LFFIFFALSASDLLCVRFILTESSSMFFL